MGNGAVTLANDGGRGIRAAGPDSLSEGCACVRCTIAFRSPPVCHDAQLTKDERERDGRWQAEEDGGSVHEPLFVGCQGGTRRLVPGTRFPVATTVRDALYDRIPLGEPEIAIIGTQAFLRLDRIQQLGFVSRVWPGAKHTRYEHSLGVFHLARLAVEHLRSLPEGEWITDEDARTICAAALLHDVGH